MTDSEAKNLRDHSGVFVPPPLIYVFFFVIGMFLPRVWSIGILSPPIGHVVGSVFIVAGIALIAWSAQTFRLAKTSVIPVRPTTAVVTYGPYRFTRNPMYVALSLLYLGAAFWLNLVWPLLLLPVVLLVVDSYVIAREEKYLERKFGGEYLQYKSRVRRWI
jgi:protein-S-isoprenylcysteine O-methyltransferase Ste14